MTCAHGATRPELCAFCRTGTEPRNDLRMEDLAARPLVPTPEGDPMKWVEASAAMTRCGRVGSYEAEDLADALRVLADAIRGDR